MDIKFLLELQYCCYFVKDFLKTISRFIAFLQ